MITCFLAGNTHPTIPHSLRALAPPGAAADSRPDKGKGSSLYEVNIWMWRYGTGHQRKVSVLKAVEARVKRLREARARAGEMGKRRCMAAEPAGGFSL